MPGMGMCDRVGDIVYAAAWSDPKTSVKSSITID